jgi:hypothetical protein
VGVGRPLQFRHGDLGCWSVEVLYKYVSYTRSLLALCPQRSPISVEIGIYDTAERSYSGLSIPDALPSFTAVTSRVRPPLNCLFKRLGTPPSLRKREVVTDIEPAPLTLQVTNVERPIPAAPTDAYAQAGQETITQFDDFIVARTHGIQSFRSQGLNTPRHIKLYQKVPKRFQEM